MKQTIAEWLAVVLMIALAVLIFCLERIIAFWEWLFAEGDDGTHGQA